MVFEALARDTRRHEAVLLLVLTFGTGIVDAVSYLALSRAIAGNMSGNVILLGMALTGRTHLQVAGPAVAFAAFWVGAQGCGLVLRSRPDGWTLTTSRLIATSGVVVGATAIVLVLVPVGGHEAVGLGAAGVLGACMGLQAATARAIGVPDLPTDVVTTALTDLGFDRGRRSPLSLSWGRRMGSLTLIGAGAVVGAALVQVHVALALGLVALLSIGVAVAGVLAVDVGRPGSRPGAR